MPPTQTLRVPSAPGPVAAASSRLSARGRQGALQGRARPEVAAAGSRLEPGRGLGGCVGLPSPFSAVCPCR